MTSPHSGCLHTSRGCPNLGRFLQADPVQGGSCNNYDYTCGDPINATDLDGRCGACGVIAAIGIIAMTVSAAAWKWFAGALKAWDAGRYATFRAKLEAAKFLNFWHFLAVRAAQIQAFLANWGRTQFGIAGCNIVCVGVGTDGFTLGVGSRGFGPYVTNSRSSTVMSACAMLCLFSDGLHGLQPAGGLSSSPGISITHTFSWSDVGEFFGL